MHVWLFVYELICAIAGMSKNFESFRSKNVKTIYSGCRTEKTFCFAKKNKKNLLCKACIVYYLYC